MKRERIAAQPVSWGINYLPGWGRMVGADRILREVKELGLNALEYQPGLFPEDAGAARRLFAESGIRPAAGWIPVALAQRDRAEELERFRAAVRFVSALGAPIATIGAAGPGGDFEERVELGDREWGYLTTGLDEISEIAAEHGVEVALHPHVGTAVEREADIERVLGTSSVSFCFDAGHIAAAGGDAVRIARLIAPRTVHLHLKDVDAEINRRLVDGEIGWAEAVGQGVFTPLGQGDLDLRAILTAFAEYEGAVVIEQDIRLLEDGSGPEQDPFANMKTSIEFLEEVA
ncbi:sugar phosphate isomerase/epimerase [Gulosibacter sp. 10]|uniref:sugar phosphate isomerase/epimerase family protein n=1 Tax=Gulosibacter sp. 10 TaxID=1255570 RepID=UPI00097ED762|nr:sugar phosphate isomerase/epimerase [Gulosibacter sp. 10]SJM71793.1 Inosose dehydratase [Gulosibacter sp. 10]